MWPFKRRKQSQNATVPPEVQQYYESEHRERVGLAWLIAFLSLVATIAIVIGLFFGGRWIYRKTFHKNTNAGSTQALKPGQAQPLPGPSSKQSSATSVSKNQQTKSSNQAISNKSNSSTNSSSTSAVTNKANKPAVGTKSASSNQSQSTSKNLSNTGPGNVIAIFAIAVAAGTMVYELVGYYRLNKQIDS